MKILFKETWRKGFRWIVNHPKKFFAYSMIFLSLSFVGSLIQGIFFPSDSTFKIRPPLLYSNSQMAETTGVNNEKEMRKIVEELKLLKEKRDRKELQKRDSVRIEYLFNQYQQLKYGH